MKKKEFLDGSGRNEGQNLTVGDNDQELLQP
jgi:hypothetical protein